MYQAAWKRFYVAKPRPDEGTGWLRGTNLVLMTSAGRLLSGTVKDRNGLAQGLQEVLDAYGAIGGKAIPDLRAALTDSSWRIRLAAARALGDTGDTSSETVAALRALETDASSKVRARAVAVLKKMDAPKPKPKTKRK